MEVERLKFPTVRNGFWKGKSWPESPDDSLALRCKVLKGGLEGRCVKQQLNFDMPSMT